MTTIHRQHRGAPGVRGEAGLHRGEGDGDVVQERPGAVVQVVHLPRLQAQGDGPARLLLLREVPALHAGLRLPVRALLGPCNDDGQTLCHVYLNHTYPTLLNRPPHRTAPHSFILSINCTDASGSSYITAFDDVASVVLGKSAEELNSYKTQGACLPACVNACMHPCRPVMFHVFALLACLSCLSPPAPTSD